MTTPDSPSNTDELRQRLAEVEQEVVILRAELALSRASPHRKRLQATRNSLTHKFALGQHEGYMTVGLFDDGRPGEIFLTMAKEGSTIGGLMDTIGILTSLALQYGVPVESLARKFEYVSFEPSGWTRDPTIRRASSVIDYIFRWLGMQFSGTYREEKLAMHGNVTPPREYECQVTADEKCDLSPLENDRVGGTREQIGP